MKTNLELVEYAKSALQLKTRYMWGGLMRKDTDDYITMLKKMYPSQYTPDRVATLKTDKGSAYGVDCVGLIKSFVFGGVGSPQYDGGKDVSTNGLFNVAQETGYIKTLPEIPGVVVYKAGHVGIYIGSGMVIEATLGGYGDGVVETQVTERGWTHWLKVPWIEYVETADDPPTCMNCVNYKRR